MLIDRVAVELRLFGPPRVIVSAREERLVENGMFGFVWDFRPMVPRVVQVGGDIWAGVARWEKLAGLGQCPDELKFYPSA